MKRVTGLTGSDAWFELHPKKAALPTEALFFKA